MTEPKIGAFLCWNGWLKSAPRNEVMALLIQLERCGYNTLPRLDL